MDLWSPVEVATEEVLEITRGGEEERDVASTGCGIKERLAEREDRSIQASRFGWMSERRKGIGWWPNWVLV